MLRTSIIAVPFLLLCYRFQSTHGYSKNNYMSNTIQQTRHCHRSSSTIRTTTLAAKDLSSSSRTTTTTTTQQSPSPTRLLGAPICEYHTVDIPTSQQGPPRQAISVEDLTPTIQSMLQQSGMQQGVVHVLSRHTTTAITINERESRLAQDMQDYFLQLAPPDERSSAETAKKKDTRYKHNDIDQRPDSMEEAQRCRENGWDIDDPAELQKWRDQEPINAHSHLLSMLLGSSESIPVVDGKMVIGQV